MKIRTLIPIIAGIAVLAAAAPACAEPEIRQEQVQFQKGTSGATVKGSIKGRQVIDYRVRAAAGQNMDVTLKAGKASARFNVLAADDIALFVGSVSGNQFSGLLPKDGEYTIRVYQMGHAKSSGQRSNFTLDVAITGGTPKAAASPSAADDDRLVEASARASQRTFNATGKIPCAQHKGQPMGPCDFGVARAGGGTAAVAITRPDGRTRVILFKAGKAVAADLSQADGDMSFGATQEADLHLIRAGNERYEIPEAVISGG